jgi:aryl-alcohol dehydrogenase-like predicted oxidoreductase
MQQRTLGQDGLRSSAIGLGCMGMSDMYGPADEAESIATVRRALDLGVTLLDTADVYGFGHNERLLAKAIAGRRDEVSIATKCAIVRKADDHAFFAVDGSPDYIRRACDGSLRRLGIDTIDLYYLHRIDPKVPVEDSIGAMSELVRAGKVRYLGLSEAGPGSIRRAHAAHPIAALQSEYSLWTRDPEREVLPALRELGIGFVPFSPLGRGMLGGAISSPAALAPQDFRRTIPRFQGDNLTRNAALLRPLAEHAAARGMSLAQLCLAWVVSAGDDVVPIPGTKRRKYLEDNVAAAGVALSPAERDEIARLLPPESVHGARYAERAMAQVDR